MYAFDRQVIPAGAVALGTVTGLLPIPKWQRVRAILNGDFTPLHTAPIEFTPIVMPDGSRLPLHMTLEELERWHIRQTLQKTGGVLGGRKGGAMRLGLPRTTLISKMKRLGVNQG